VPRPDITTGPGIPSGTPRVIFCGSTTLDTIFRVDALPEGPGKVLPHEMAVVAHGMAASAAAAAARLGSRSFLWSRLGADDTGRRICAELSAEGVDCSGVRRFDDKTSGLCTVLVDREGERLVVPFYDPSLPDEADWLPLDLVAGADAAMADVRWPRGAEALLDAACLAGIPAVLDADIGPRNVLLNLAGRASHAVFSEPAARIASGLPDVEAALEWLDFRLKGIVAITLGPKGCIWRDDGQVHRLPGHRILAVDTLAAGDVFHGVLTWALAQGVALDRGLVLANAAAAIKCQSFGGRRGAPDRAGIARFLEATCN